MPIEGTYGTQAQDAAASLERKITLRDCLEAVADGENEAYHHLSTYPDRTAEDMIKRLANDIRLRIRELE